jgi:hypothetical protein
MRPVWPFVPKDAFWMSGYGKDICVVIPSLDMIIAHQTARAGNLEQALSDRPEFLFTLLSKVMAAVVSPSASPSAQATATVEQWDSLADNLHTCIPRRVDSCRRHERGDNVFTEVRIVTAHR